MQFTQIQSFLGFLTLIIRISWRKIIMSDKIKCTDFCPSSRVRSDANSMDNKRQLSQNWNYEKIS